MSDLLIKIISFDMGCTLFWEPACEKHNAEPVMRQQFNELIKEAEKLGYEIPTRDNLYELYFNIGKRIWNISLEREPWHKYILLRFFFELGVSIKLDDLEHLYWFFIDTIAKRFTIPRRHRQLLEYLSGMGYYIVLTTSTGAHDLPLRILQYTGVKDYFKQVFSTQLVGLLKTDPRFYMEIADTLNINPNRIVHIGDSLTHDILPAKKAGYRTILFDWRTKCRPSDTDACVTDLWDILDYL